MKDKGTAYVLWLAGFFGFAGLHRFYVGKPVTGVLWFLTGGLLGIGTLVDAFLIPGMVEEKNHKLLGGRTVHLHLHGAQAGDVVGALGGPRPVPALPPAKQEAPEKQILRVAAQRGGVVTAQLVALHTDLSLKDAKRELDAMVAQGHCTVDVAADGAEVYTVSGLGDLKPVF